MRTFLLGSKSDLGDDLTALTVGQLAFSALVNGQHTVDSDGTKIKDKGYIFLGKEDAKGGDVIVPIYKNNFSFTKMIYQAASAYTGDFTIPAPTVGDDLTVVVVKKGVQFNERNKWTATMRVKDGQDASACAKELTEQLNNNPASGVKAVAAAAKITITAVNKGEDYKIALGDDLFGVAVTETPAVTPLADANYIKDLAMKAAADAGIEYTYQDPANLIYPGYPLNPLAQPDSVDAGYTVFTLKFAEPREMKTVDQSINQIVQIALPMGATAIAKVETILKAIAKGETILKAVAGVA
ncbi:putative tail sheath protein [uncultured phage cr11_1]|uniref:Putative tail sheath protein n=1 Tax=uncultured phage cr11_1 TaxID=2772067 RepID=A0A7M1RXC7_9CAUD|nr:putative tail sheath protein [uncultured phage cr11_1]QOR58784.1 putative tail sheath protein [uncultured phage cr11_1]